MISGHVKTSETWARLVTEKRRDTILAVCLGAFLYSAFGALDWFIFPSVALKMLPIRLIVVVELLCVLALILTAPKAYLVCSQPVFAVLALTGGGGIIWMNGLVAGLPGGDAYYAGLILVVAYIFAFIPLRFGYAAALDFALILGYNASLLFSEIPLSIAVSNNFFLVSAAIICGKGCFDSQRLMFQQYENEAIISAQKAEVDAQRKRADNLLHQILPDPIAQRLLLGTSPIADGYSDVTVLFADLSGFTAFSTSVSPRSLVGHLNRIFSAFDDVAARLGVEKIKTIGDAYMAACGLPTEVDDHPERMVCMAIGMRDEIHRIRREFPDFNLDIRIGINTGPCVAGVIGNQRFIYDLWGDTVNLASRMESTGIPGQIQVTEATYLRLRHVFNFQSRGNLEIKGRGPMKAYLLMSPAALSQSIQVSTTAAET
jgi:class 3 adenylate cyclase